MEHKKDYSLLRPFDLEAAKWGDKIFWLETECTFFGNSCNEFSKPMYVVEHVSGMSYAPSNELRISPLAWVEGRPVYKGDVLYKCNLDDSRTAISPINGESFCVYCKDDISGGLEDIDRFVTLTNYLTWEKHKTKRYGWVNVYDQNFHACQRDADISSNSGRIACVHVEFEE